MAASTLNVFDEDFYLNQYSDIRKAVDQGIWRSGYAHYVAFGRDEGRSAFRFDEDFYAGAYPVAAGEVEAGLARDFRAHYELIGWHRGYLPHQKAPRGHNPQSALSRFGGLWPDLPHALDIVAGRLEIGQITDPQAELLRTWIRNGYVVLKSAIPADELDAAQEAFDKAYSGGFESLRFACDQLSKERMTWVPEHCRADRCAGRAIERGCPEACQTTGREPTWHARKDLHREARRCSGLACRSCARWQADIDQSESEKVS